MVKYDPSIKKDDYISLEETVEAWKPYGLNLYPSHWMLESYETNPEKMLKEYNCTEEYISYMKTKLAD
jgi:hypothetical protein